MDLWEWASNEIWPFAVAAVITAYLFTMVRIESRNDAGVPEKPDWLKGFDVQWCSNCSIWVPAKAPWCGVRGCPRPHSNG
ncbi:MAG: hypothetical protein NBV67_09805 [Tagaea sp.]|nr:hypothetical protein [Tagaea sp.]